MFFQLKYKDAATKTDVFSIVLLPPQKPNLSRLIMVRLTKETFSDILVDEKIRRCSTCSSEGAVVAERFNGVIKNLLIKLVFEKLIF